MDDKRKLLIRWIRLLGIMAGLSVLFVAIDFSFNRPDAPEHRFMLPDLPMNRPVLLREGSLQLIVARFDAQTLAGLSATSRLSKISQSFRSETRRSDDEGFFVALAYGVNACPLDITDNGYREVCSDAEYDLLGRSSNPQRYPDLEIPGYTFSRNHTVLTIE